MIGKRYIIASADPEFMGPLAPGYLGGNKKYIGEFGISSHVGIDVNPWNKSSRNYSKAVLDAIRSGNTSLVNELRAQFEKTGIERLPKISKTYTSNPSEALLLDNFEADIVSFMLNSVVDRRGHAFQVEESHAFESELVH